MDSESRGTILVVDDEPQILTALEDLLEDDYRVLTSASPLEALEILKRERDIAVIVSDQRMPVMTGDVFLAQAREISGAEALLLTGYADLSAVIDAVNNGRIAGYSPKPWEPAALRSMIGQAYERQRLARALDVERRLLRGLLDHSRDALSFKDAEGRFVRLNEVKAQRLGRSVADCLGQREVEFLPPEAAARLDRLERNAVATAQVAESVEEGTAPDGAPRWYQVSRVPLLDAAGNVAYLASFERDITASRHLEARLRQTDKMQALGTMAGGVAHDFNNLLTAILGSLELASDGVAEDPRLSRLLRNATFAAQRGAALTQRLLSFSRQRDMKFRSIDINRLITGMEDLLERTLGGISRIERRLSGSLWLAKVDPDQLELALLNLCVNARDAMPDGGAVTLATRNASVGKGEVSELSPGDYVVVSVSDTGTGMAPEVLARVFEPFFTTKEVGKGTGLGLSMVYGLAQQSGGTIRIESKRDVGTVVDLYLPRSLEAASLQAGPEHEVFPVLPPARILVVDDDPDVREVTTAFLSELGHDVLQAADGQSGLEVLKRRADIDLVVADFAMPGLTGLELAEAAGQLRPDLPILLVTGYADLAKVPEKYPVLHKPFRRSDLAIRLVDLFRRKEVA